MTKAEICDLVNEVLKEGTPSFNYVTKYKGYRIRELSVNEDKNGGTAAVLEPNPAPSHGKCIIVFKWSVAVGACEMVEHDADGVKKMKAVLHE